MTPAEVATACQTPLVDLLRAIPADAVLRWDDGPYSSHSAPVGRMAHEAADALAAQAAEIERMREALNQIADGSAPPIPHGHYLAHREAVKIAREALA